MKPTSTFVNCAVAILFCGLAAQGQQVNEGSSAFRQIAATRTLPPPATVTGSGTTDYILKWTGSTTLGNSILFQTGGKIGVGTTTPTVALDVNGRVNASRSYRLLGYDILTLPKGSLANIALGFEALQNLTSGTQGTAVGTDALQNDTAGSNNTAIGSAALQATTTGAYNTAGGALTLIDNVDGNFNTAFGMQAMQVNTSGSNNTAIGSDSLLNNSTGGFNTAVGFQSLIFTSTGSNNIGIGYQSGLGVTSGDNNIEIGSTGGESDNNATRIGTTGIQTSFFAAGIRGVMTGANDAVPVVIDSNGQLGTVSSSRRFKEDIQEMGDASQGLMHLRPVTFRYQKAFEDGSNPTQYGLIAEEVAEVYPNLVAHSADGQIETVKYQVLDSMLLNEVQRQQKEIQSLQERLAKLEALLASSEGTNWR